jgi:hypothetical protein
MNHTNPPLGQPASPSEKSVPVIRPLGSKGPPNPRPKQKPLKRKWTPSATQPGDPPAPSGREQL